MDLLQSTQAAPAPAEVQAPKRLKRQQAGQEADSFDSAMMGAAQAASQSQAQANVQGSPDIVLISAKGNSATKGQEAEGSLADSQARVMSEAIAGLAPGASGAALPTDAGSNKTSLQSGLVFGENPELAANPKFAANPKLAANQIAGRTSGSGGAKGRVSMESIATDDPLQNFAATRSQAVAKATGEQIDLHNGFGRDWVFQAGDAQRPGLHGIFDKTSNEAPMAELTALLNEARAKAMQGESGKAGVRGAAITQAGNVNLQGGILPPGVSAESIEDTNELGAHSMVGSPGHVTNLGNRSGSLSGADFVHTMMNAKAAQAASQGGGKLGIKGQVDSELGMAATTSMPQFIDLTNPGQKINADRPKSWALDDAASPYAAGSMAHTQLFRENGTQIPIQNADISGNVTLGAMAQPRLARESLTNITNQISGFSIKGGAQSAGEIRMKLKPENLGELHLKVVTDGNQVGIQIRASDENARKVLEESVSALKDSLRAQNLNLTKIEVTIGHMPQMDMGSQSQERGQPHLQNFNQNPFQFQSGLDQGQGGGRSFEGSADESPADVGSRLARGARAQSALLAASNGIRPNSAEVGRLDVVA